MSNATQATTAILPARKEQVALKAILESEGMKRTMAEVLPKHVTADRIVKVVLSCTMRKPELLNCSLPSICKCVMQASELGLELGGLLGEAYLVPYGKEANCIIGYQGLLKLARQSDQIASTAAHVVYEDDLFEADYGANTVRHVPNLKASHDDAKIAAAWAKTVLKDGATLIEVMTRGDIDRVRGRSAASNSGPWVTDYAEMARKTVLRRHLKYVPRSAELAKALETVSAIEDIALPALPETAAVATTASLEEELRTKKEKAPKAAKEKPAAAPQAEQGPAKEARSTKCAGCGEEIDFAKPGAEKVNGVFWHAKPCLAEAQKAEQAMGGREPGEEG